MRPRERLLVNGHSAVPYLAGGERKTYTLIYFLRGVVAEKRKGFVPSKGGVSAIFRLFIYLRLSSAFSPIKGCSGTDGKILAFFFCDGRESRERGTRA